MDNKTYVTRNMTAIFGR